MRSRSKRLLHLRDGSAIAGAGDEIGSGLTLVLSDHGHTTTSEDETLRNNPHTRARKLSIPRCMQRTASFLFNIRAALRFQQFLVEVVRALRRLHAVALVVEVVLNFVDL